MQRQTIQSSISPPHKAGVTRRILALLAALGLVLGVAACDQDDSNQQQKQAQKPAAEQSQTPAGKEGEPTTNTDTVGDENIQQKDQSNADADKVPTEPGAEEQAPVTQSNASNKPSDKQSGAAEKAASPDRNKDSSEQRVSPEELKQE